MHDQTIGKPLSPTLTENLTDQSKALIQTIEEGHETMPQDRPLLVCKPMRVESWRIFKIMSEFVEGFDIIRRYGLSVTIFGSARPTFEDVIYEHATELAKRLSKQGFTVITGGSQGVMQAANKGAFEAGGSSLGLNIDLPNGQGYNKFLTDKIQFEHFFVRKTMLTYASEVYVYFPGGFGTLDEFFDILTLVQTKKIRKVPIILFGRAYWTPLLTFIEEMLYKKHKAIDREDMNLYRLVDSVDEAYNYIVENVEC